MWNGARTVYGLGLNKDDLTPLFQHLLELAKASERTRFERYLRDDCSGVSVLEIPSMPAGDLHKFVLEAAVIFKSALAGLGLSLAVYPHDITERFEEGTFAVCGQTTCQLRTGNQPPKITPCDLEQVKKALVDVFGAKRVRTKAKQRENEHLVLMGCLGYYTFPEDCMCCT